MGPRRPARSVRPGLGTLVGEARVLRDRLSDERDASYPAASSLTTAELRVLPLLATHLSFPEIADQLFLSPNTVKSQAMSIYGSWRHPHAARRSPIPVNWGSWRGDGQAPSPQA